MYGQDTPAPKANNLWKVAYVGICFTALFTAYIAAQNLASKIYSDLGFDGLGSACVMVIYIFLAIGSIFASHIKRGLSHKAGFLIGSVCYTLFVLAGLYTVNCQDSHASVCQRGPIYAINLIASAFVGFGASILWLTQSDYVNQCADESTKGLYNGVFWSLMQLSQIIGSVLATVLLSLAGPHLLYLVFFIFAIFSVGMFAFTPRIDVVVTIDSKLEMYEPLSKSVAKFGRTLTNGRYVYLMMGMILIGVAIGYYAGLLAKLTETVFVRHRTSTTDAEIGAQVGYALIALALGEVSAGVIVGKLGDAMKKNHVLHLCILTGEIALVLCFICYIADILPLAFAAGFIWGFCDTGLNTIIGSIIGAYYDGALELFSLMRFLTGIGSAVTSAFILIIGKEQFIICSVIAAAVIGLLHMVFMLTSRGLKYEEQDKQALLDNADVGQTYI